MNKHNRKHFITQLEFQVGDAKAEIERFTSRFSKNPAYALESCGQIFSAAASLKVLNQVLALARKENLTEADIRQECLECAMRTIKLTSKSANPAADIMEAETRAAWARAWNNLRYFEFYGEENGRRAEHS